MATTIETKGIIGLGIEADEKSQNSYIIRNKHIDTMKRSFCYWYVNVPLCQQDQWLFQRLSYVDTLD